MKDKLIIVAGPTAVGKSEYAIDLANKYDGEIVSLDSVQVYKYLDIGSAKLSMEEMQGIPHYMIDEVEPSVNLNVKDFKDMASAYINDILNRGKLPILVGGTGFYIRSVLYDTDFLLEDEAEAAKIRNNLYERYEKEGIDGIFEELKTCDKLSAELIPKGNARRIIRALEFYYLHKMPISTHNRLEKEKESHFDFEYYVLDMERDKLYSRINDRVDKMMQKGLLKEVKGLINRGLSKDLNSMKSIGYSELYDFCQEREEINDISELSNEDQMELANLIELIKQHTRNYAKRQLTWFRSQDGVKWINRK